MDIPLLVTTEWLDARLGDPRVRIVDVRWALLDRDKGRAAYAAGHIPGAVFLDVNEHLASPRGQGPGRHPLPTPEAFAAVMSRAGVDADTHVIAYDFGDGSTAARVWWLLRYLGHPRVSLLDGGFAAWSAAGLPLETPTPVHEPATFVPAPYPTMFVDAATVDRMRTDPNVLILDTRFAERYEGKTEPVDPVAGHIPGARNRPYPSNVRSAEDPRFKDAAELRAEFMALGADPTQRIVAYCGSGVNACQNIFALELAGFPGALLYEGSWSDWCSVPERAMKASAEP